MAWTDHLEWPPDESALSGVAAVVAVGLAVGIALTASDVHVVSLAIWGSFFVLALVNLVLGMPRISLSVGCVGCGQVAGTADVPPVLGDPIGSIWLWVFVGVAMATLAQAIYTGATRERIRELDGVDAGTD